MADKPPKTGHGPKIGTVNLLECTLGQRGMGKSTYQCARARDLVREYHGQAYVIGHSLGARLPMSLPPELGGGELPIEYHATIDELDRALRARPTKWHILAPPLSIDRPSETYVQDTCDDLIKYSIRLSESLRKRAYERAHPIKSILKDSARRYDGLPCPAVIIVVDEGVAFQSASTGKDKKSRKDRDWFLEWIYSLRHYHTALLYAIQNPSARSWLLLAEATRVIVFRVKHQWALNAINAAGGTRRETRAARKLAPHDYIALGEDPTLADDDDEDDIPREVASDDESDEESSHGEVRGDQVDDSD
jgi:hypothetical protein